MTDADEIGQALAAIAAALNATTTPYAVTGSLASSAHGEFRATNDLDILADLDPTTVTPLLRALAPDFHVDPAQAREAVAARTSFNVIHRGTFLKVDVFLAGTPYDYEALRRAREHLVPGSTGRLRILTVEDILLNKLRWFRLGGESSDTQVRDIRALVALNRSVLDLPYLAKWSHALGLGELLDRFLAST